MTTTIQISDKLWEILNQKKQRGETFEDVIKTLVNDSKTKSSGGDVEKESNPIGNNLSFSPCSNSETPANSKEKRK